MSHPDTVSSRKREHLELVASDASEPAVRPGWHDVRLIHRSVPRRSVHDIQTSTRFLGHTLEAPVMIAAMTGGHEVAMRINQNLAKAAERLGIAIGVGSQRAALIDPCLAPTYAVIREAAPTAMVVANLGICQLVEQGGEPPLDAAHVQSAVDMVGAQALAIHLNILEECIQPEGDVNMGSLDVALQEVVAECTVPVIAKETGCGVSRESAAMLAASGVAAIDVGGAGGTNFAAVESRRAAARGDERRARMGTLLADWGIPTAMSILEAVGCVPIIATGGVRSGVDAAKALALGADVVGLGRPALLAAMESADAVLRELEQIIHELRVTVLLTGGENVADLSTSGYVLSGDVLTWWQQRTPPRSD